MKTKLSVLFIVVMLTLMMTVIGTTSATFTQVQSFDVEMMTPASDCDDVSILIRTYVENIPTTFYIGIIIKDGNDTPINGVWAELAGPTVLGSLSFVSNTISRINNITARPITIEVYDLNNTYNTMSQPPTNSLPHNMTVYNAIIAEPLMANAVYDPGVDNADCATLPNVAPIPGPTPDPITSPSQTVSVFGNDGRINADQAAPFVAYAVAGGLQIYTPQGNLLFAVTADDISKVECPTTGDALIKKVGNISLFRTAGCGFLMTSPSINGEKTYYLQFASLTSRSYTSFEQ